MHFLTLLLSCALLGAPLLVWAEEGPCREEGIVVRNATTIVLWYKKEGGDCYRWAQQKLFTIRPDEKIEIFSDLVCQTFYCRNNPTFDDYRAVDSDGNCRVRILPDCNLSDM